MTKKPPRYYTTTKAASASAQEVAEVVRKHGARQFSIEWDEDGEPAAICFVMDVQAVGAIPVRMRAQVEGLTRRLEREAGPGSRKDREDHEQQARRIAWRQLLSYVEMTLELVENGVRQFHEAFMADVVLESGRRLVEEYEAHSGRLLPAGECEDDDVEVIRLPGGA